MNRESSFSTMASTGLEVRLLDPTDSQSPLRGRVGCPGVLVVGKLSTSDVVLPAHDENASRLHFEVDLDSLHCRLTNRSKNGTFVNGLLIQSQCDMRHGDIIRAGRSVFVVQLLRGGEATQLALSPTVLLETFSELPDSGKASLPDESPEPTLPQFPGYRFVHKLGRGGMGEVWLAENHKGQQVAFKWIRSELAPMPEVCARFRRETNHLRDLNHRHIVGFRESGEYKGLLYLVMDYVPGNNLDQMLQQQGVFGVERAVRLLCQVLEALKEAHNNGVVHRDVKPSNILVQSGPDGEECRLADFGMAKVYQSPEAIPTLTLPGVAGGTLAFAAPEMVTDFRLAGPLADQYGAAATLYYLLSSCLLHDAKGPIDLLDKIRTEDAVLLSRRRTGLPEPLIAAIHKALNREPGKRHTNIQTFRETLLPYYRDLTPNPLP